MHANAETDIRSAGVLLVQHELCTTLQHLNLDAIPNIHAHDHTEMGTQLWGGGVWCEWKGDECVSRWGRQRVQACTLLHQATFTTFSCDLGATRDTTVGRDSAQKRVNSTRM